MELRVPGAADWRNALVAGDTGSFLLLVRNYLGPVKTPYSKHELVARLESFILDPVNAKAALSYLEDDELDIIIAIILMGPLSSYALEELFAYRRRSSDLDSMVTNLVDRMVLFHWPEADYALAVCPALRDAASSVVDIKRFFEMEPTSASSASAAAGAGTEPWLTEDLICTVFSSLFHGKKIFRKNNALTKKAQDAVIALAPELEFSQTPELETRFSDLIESFRNSGVIEQGEEGAINSDAFGALCDRADTGMLFEFAAARHCESSEDGSYRSFVVDARLLRTIYEALPEDTVFGGMGLWRYVRYVACACSLPQATEFSIDLLVRFGFVKGNKQGYVKASLSRQQSRQKGKASLVPQKPVVIEASHVVKILPEADADTRRFLAIVSRPESRNVTVQAVVDRDSIFDAFDSGLGASTIAMRLVELSGIALPQSLQFSMESWEKEYQSVRLYFGYTIVAKGPSAVIVEHSPAMKRLAVRNLGEGIYFVATDAKSEIDAALIKSGLRLPARVAGSASIARVRVRKATHPKQINPEMFRQALEQPLPARKPADSAKRIAALKKALKLMDKKDWERDELEERIEKKIILTVEQLAIADFPAVGRLEAGSLDFLGKARVAEDAIGIKDARLDIQYKLKGEDPVRIIVRPVELKKDARGLMLVTQETGTGRVVEIAISSVSKIKRLRTGFFGEK